MNNKRDSIGFANKISTDRRVRDKKKKNNFPNLLNRGCDSIFRFDDEIISIRRIFERERERKREREQIGR